MGDSKVKQPLLKASTLAVGLGALFLAGCSVSPEAITAKEVANRVQEDQYRIYSDQEQVFKPITFNDAVARSLKYNLDYRLKLMESALNSGLLEVAKFDMLPNLVASAGYTSRNNLTGSHSFQIVDGEAVDTDPPTYSGGVERQREVAGVEFSWSLLDFGLGYYRAKQQANQVLIAEERRRRVVQNILQDVRASYWRAVGAQRLADRAEALLGRAKDALARSHEAEAQGLVPAKDALAYQRVLLDAVNLLSSRRQELAYAKRELAALMNVTPGTDFRVDVTYEAPLQPVPLNVAELEELALHNRPELRQEDYQARITADEARAQLLSLLPNLRLNVGHNYDSNKYLYNNDWLEASTQVTFNMSRVFAMPATRRASEGQKQVDDLRRMALSMAILTQVRVAIERYRTALDDLSTAQQSSQVDQRMASYARAAYATRTESEMELIRAETRSLNSDYQRYAAYAAAQAAYGRIYSSLGLEVVPPNVEAASVTELGNAVESFLKQIERETFIHFETVPQSNYKVGFKLDGSNADFAGVDWNMVEAGVVNVLSRNQIEVIDDAATDFTVAMTLSADKMSKGVRRSHWDIQIFDVNGRLVGNTRYTTSLSAKPDGSAVTAFAEAAVIANVQAIDEWMSLANER